jgi:hypothetical protein
MIWKMPNRRSILIVILLATWWALITLLAWKWSAGLYRIALESFTCVASFPLPPASRFAAHWAKVAAGATALAFILFSLAGSGRAALGFIRAPRLSASEEFSMQGLAGTGLFCTAVFALGLAGLLFPMVMLGAWGAALAIAAFRRPARPAWPAGGTSGAVVVLLLVVLATFSLAPEATEDALVYHLGAPAHFLSIHKIADAPHLKFRWPLLTENLSASFAGVLGPAVYRWTGFALLSILLFGWIRRIWGETAALIGLFCLLASPGQATLATLVKPDVFASAFVLLAVILWTERSTPATAFLCGTALGFAYCTKQTTVAAGAGMVLWHLFRPEPVRWKHAIVGFAVAVLSFLARSWLATRNPIYPFWFGGLGWSALSPALYWYGWPPADLLPGNPALTATSLGRFLTAEAPLALFGIAVLVASRQPNSASGRHVFRLLTWTAGSVVVLVWVFKAPYSRFFIPFLPVLFALGAAGVARLAASHRRLAMGLAACILVPGFIRVIALANLSGPVPKLTLPASLGVENPEDYLARTLTGYQRAVVLARSTLAGPGRLLVVGDARGALFSPDHVTVSQDIPDFSLILAVARESRDGEEIRRRFRQLGITTVALNYVNSLRLGRLYAALGAQWKDAELARYYGYFSRYGEQAGPADAYDLNNGGWVFFRIRKTPKTTGVAKGNAGRAAPAPGAGRPAHAMLATIAMFTFLPGTEGLSSEWKGENAWSHLARLNRLARIAPGVADYRCRLGVALDQAGDYQNALIHLKAGLSAEFPEAAPYGALGLILKSRGQAREAREAFRRAAALEPENPVYCAESMGR